MTTKKNPAAATKFSADQVEILSAPLEKSKVSERVGPSGKKLQYLEGWQVIEHANHVFGFDGWDRETIEMHEMWTGSRTTYDRNGNETVKRCVAFRCKVKVTVHVGGRAIVREGTGFGDGQGKDLGEAFELATKEAETDAMKRAFMTFGNGFGLALYDKSRENVVDDTKDAKARAPAQEERPRDPPRQPDRAPREATKEAPPRETRHAATEQERLEAGTPLDRRGISQSPEDRREVDERTAEQILADAKGNADKALRDAKAKDAAKPKQGEALAKSKAAAGWKAVEIPIPQDGDLDAWNAWTSRLEKGIETAPNRSAALDLCKFNAKAMEGAGDVIGTDIKKWAFGRLTHYHGAEKKEASR